MLFGLSAILPLAASAQGNSEAAQSCQGEGYLNYTDANGNAFKNAGQCASYAAQGATLVPVVIPDPGVVAHLSIVATQTRTDGGLMTYSGSGLLPGSSITERTYWVVESAPGPGDTQVEFVIGTADENGDFLLVTGFVCDKFLTITLLGVAADGTGVSGTADFPC